MGTIVVGIDGSETSRAAFSEAVNQAKWRESSVLAIHVVSYPMLQGYDITSLDLDSFRRRGVEFMEREIEELKDQFDGSFPTPVETRVVLGHTGVELIRAAQDETDPAELVVLGSRGLGGFRGLLLGSVTTYMINRLPCRLLVVPAS